MELIRDIITNDYFLMFILVAIVVSITHFWKAFQKKYSIQKEDIDLVINGVTIGDSLLRRMGVIKKESSKKTTRLITDTLSFVQTLDGKTQEEKVKTAVDYYKNMSSEIDIAVDEEMELIIENTFKKIIK